MKIKVDKHWINLPYNSFQLNKIKDFLREKSAEYKVTVPDIKIDANFVRHSPRTCQCKDCHELAPESVSNTIANSYDFVKGLKKAMMSLKIPTLDILFGNLHRIGCPIAKSTLSSIILDKAIQYCTDS
jgi:hypothetical protein